MTDPNITFDDRVALAKIAREIDLEAAREWARAKIVWLAREVLDVSPAEYVWTGETVWGVQTLPVARIGASLLTIDTPKQHAQQCDCTIYLVLCWSCSECSAILPLRRVTGLADLAGSVPTDKKCIQCQLAPMIEDAIAIPGSRERRFRRLRRVVRPFRYPLLFLWCVVGGYVLTNVLLGVWR